MKKPTMNITEDNIRDVIASLSSGHLGSYMVEETIGATTKMVDNFETASIETIKEAFRKRMEDSINVSLANECGGDLIHYGNAHTVEGVDLEEIGARGIYRPDNMDVSLSLSEQGLGFTGSVDVEMADGSTCKMDVVFAPTTSMDSDELYEVMDTSSPNDMDAGGYFIRKYCDPKLLAACKTREDEREASENAYENIPDSTKDLLDEIGKNGMMGLDWDDLTPHAPNLTYVKQDSVKTSEQTATLNEGLMSEVVKQDKQMGE